MLQRTAVPIRYVCILSPAYTCAHICVWLFLVKLQRKPQASAMAILVCLLAHGMAVNQQHNKLFSCLTNSTLWFAGSHGRERGISMCC